MPRPNAAWRFSARSSTTWSASLEDLGVAVGGREGQQDPVAGLHRAAVELGVLGHDPGHRDRGVGPQELLDGRGHQLGLGGEARAVVGVLGQVPQRRADRAPRRVDAGDQEQQRIVPPTCSASAAAVDLGVEQVAW